MDSAEDLLTSSAILTVTSETSIADDKLRGGKAISEFTGEPEWRVYYDYRHGRLPLGKQGGVLIGSKKVLREHYLRLTRGELESPPAPPPRQHAPAPPLRPARRGGGRRRGIRIPAEAPQPRSPRLRSRPRKPAVEQSTGRFSTP